MLNRKGQSGIPEFHSGSIEIDAVMAYDVSARAYFGEFALITHRDTAAVEVILGRSFPSNANIPVVVGV